MSLYFQICSAGNYCPPQVESPSFVGYFDSVIQPDFQGLPLGWDLSNEATMKIDEVVAPDPNMKFEAPWQYQGGLSSVLSWQADPFDGQEFNPSNVAEVMRRLNPSRDAN